MRTCCQCPLVKKSRDIIAVVDIIIKWSLVAVYDFTQEMALRIEHWVSLQNGSVSALSNCAPQYSHHGIGDAEIFIAFQ